MNAVMAAGDAGTMLPIDPIDEFRTEQNPQAQYGWKPGGVINVGVKSGTNNIHGTAYAYGRSNSCDARYVLQSSTRLMGSAAQSVSLAAVAIRLTLDLEQFGASIGGPIKKDKLFSSRITNSNGTQTEIPAPTRFLLPPDRVQPVPPTASSAPASPQGQSSLRSARNWPVSAPPARLLEISLDSSCLLLVPQAARLPWLLRSIRITTIHSGIAKVDYHLNAKNSISASYFISPGNGIFVDIPQSRSPING